MTRPGRTVAAVAFAVCCIMCSAAAAEGANQERPVSSEGQSAGATTQQGIGGRVTGPSGAPIANVFVQASALDGPRAIPDIAVMTDSAGKYVWNLAPGRYRLTFMRDGRELAQREVIVRPNELTALDLAVPSRR